MLNTLYEVNTGNYLVSTDRKRIDIDSVHRFLTTSSSWASGISRKAVEQGISNSICFGLYGQGKLLAFCRVITDGATFGNLVDVFVLPEVRGNGLSKMLMRAVMAHPLVPQLRRFTLATTDAHTLYEKFGFTALSKPATFMEVYRPDIYRQQ